jgi:hypothetical protein
VTVTKGAFSIAWTIRYEDKRQLRVGKIDGTISASGSANVTASVFSPLAAETTTALEAMDDKVDDLKKVATEMKIRVQVKPKRRISLASGSCYASWSGAEVSDEAADDDAAAAQPPAAPTRVTKKTKAKPAPKKATKSKPRTLPITKTTSAPKPTTKSGTSSSSSSESKPTPPAPKPAPKNLQPGAKCEADEDCESDTCTFGQCYGRHGKPEFASGSRCMHDSDCASGECHDTCR